MAIFTGNRPLPEQPKAKAPPRCVRDGRDLRTHIPCSMCCCAAGQLRAAAKPLTFPDRPCAPTKPARFDSPVRNGAPYYEAGAMTYRS